MVAIGRALMARPKLVMLDEPSLGLAPLVVAAIFETIRQLRMAKPVEIRVSDEIALLQRQGVQRTLNLHLLLPQECLRLRRVAARGVDRVSDVRDRVAFARSRSIARFLAMPTSHPAGEPILALYVPPFVHA